MGAALRGVAAAVAPSMLDGKLGQVTFRIFSTLEHGDYRFFGTVSASKASCSPGGTKKDQLGFILTNIWPTIYFFVVLKFW